jgi:hypothetical protein
LTEINPFNRAAARISSTDAANLTPRPRFVDDLQEPVRPLSWFHPEGQDFLRHLIDGGDLPCMERDGDLYVSWHDLNPYLPPHSDPADWDENYGRLGG